ncbi:MAG: hypothetical protein ACRDRZ_02215 [Pseudonocardiaceae bacterium]
MATLLDTIAWSADYASRAGELYPHELRLQRGHEASCWSWIADAYRRFTDAT